MIEKEMQKYYGIPQTSMQYYISGFHALNTPDKVGYGADWHSFQYWIDSQNTHKEIPLWKNNSILREKGIEYREILYSKKKKVFIANFPRAIADMLLAWDENRGKKLLFSTNDYLTEVECEELYQYCKEIQKYKDISWFVKHDFTKKYYLEKEYWNRFI